MGPEDRLRDLRKLAIGWRWRLGYVLGTPVSAEYEDELAEVIKRVRRQTMTTAPRIAALCDGVEYLVRAGIGGAIVECGVWRGGSMMAAALTLIRMGETDRDLYLFDTFAGMPQPGETDESSPYDGYSIHKRWRRKRRSGWVAVEVEQVRQNVESTGYPPERIHLVEGMVEETLPERAPQSIALLRLDTDWYGSTRHELEHLYPLLASRGVLIVDDYGHYPGARRAVDEYFAASGEPVLLHRIDYTGRIAVKPPAEVPANVGGAR
jgi:O-methyltransferase